MLRHFQDIRSRNIDTGLDASEAHHTAIKPLMDERRSIWNGGTLDLLGRKLIPLDPKFIGAVLKLTFSPGIAYRTVEGMVH
jgi:hypothetical protein